MRERRPRNPLESLTFTDGRIVRCKLSRGEARLEFRDHRDVTRQITFTEVIDLNRSDHATDHDVMEGSFDFSNGTWTLRLVDDDDQILLQIEYRTAEVTSGG